MFIHIFHIVSSRLPKLRKGHCPFIQRSIFWSLTPFLSINYCDVPLPNRPVKFMLYLHPHKKFNIVVTCPALCPTCKCSLLAKHTIQKTTSKGKMGSFLNGPKKRCIRPVSPDAIVQARDLIFHGC